MPTQNSLSSFYSISRWLYNKTLLQKLALQPTFSLRYFPCDKVSSTFYASVIYITSKAAETMYVDSCLRSVPLNWIAHHSLVCSQSIGLLGDKIRSSEAGHAFFPFLWLTVETPLTAQGYPSFLLISFPRLVYYSCFMFLIQFLPGSNLCHLNIFL